MNDDATRTSTGSGPPGTPATGWLSSSDAIDHGRFNSGTVLETRYRIIGLLGRGGMGEVYRADDLRLGQQVALKFLPATLSHDPVRLAQFHNEVRMARQVSHQNVCRVYDIGEITAGQGHGQLFITMEYVDGEDLSILLRRIGRLPEDKALEIARQLCAGLAAAHARGILHRDLKPANIMLDGTGKARLMDFGLASFGAVADVRAGTPAYMAPEQLNGHEVTVRSDIYALGAVLYELFTGRRAFDAKTLGDLIEQHQLGTVTPPTELVRGLDPAIERAIVRCLDADPARRPGSALAVAASLPGGDPLGAAMAAGVTPSPQMVAAAGRIGATLTTGQGVAWLSGLVLLLFIVGWLADRCTIVGQSIVRKPPAVLAEYARQVRATAGYLDTPAYDATGFAYDLNAVKWYAAHGGTTEHWMGFAKAMPAAVRFWYRTSAATIDPHDPLQFISLQDPAPVNPGESVVELDASGRLLRLSVVPPRSSARETTPAGTPDWAALFKLAGLDATTFVETAPTVAPPSFADEVRAWEAPENRLARVEAAALHGRPVFFDVEGPWTIPASETSSTTVFSTMVAILAALIQGGLLMSVFWLAVMNVRAARADRRAAYRIALFGFSLELIVWVLVPAHSSDPNRELARFLGGFANACLYGVAFGAAFLGLEPYVRRYWPKALIGWARLMSGQVRDPVVGHDVLVGLTCGLVTSVLVYAYQAVPQMVEWPSPPGWLPLLNPLRGLAASWQVPASLVNYSIVNGLFGVFILATLRRHIRSLWLVVPIAMVIMGVIYDPTMTVEVGNPRLVALFVCATIPGVIVILRYGLLAIVAAAVTSNLTNSMIFTLDPARAYFQGSLLAAIGIAALAAAGWHLARAGEPLFSASTGD